MGFIEESNSHGEDIMKRGTPWVEGILMALLFITAWGCQGIQVKAPEEEGPLGPQSKMGRGKDTG